MVKKRNEIIPHPVFFIVTILLTIIISSLTTFLLINKNNQMREATISPETLKTMMGYKSINEIPLKTIDTRNTALNFVMKNGTKEFHLTAEPIRWEYNLKQTVLAWGYNGQIPGPEIRVTEGDKVRIILENKLPQPTTIHWHGIDVPNSQDGMPGITQEPIQPGQKYTYEFIAKPAGTRYYHTHGAAQHNEARQLDMGLSGAFIIEPKIKEHYDREYTLLLDEWSVLPDGTNEVLVENHQGQIHSNYNVFTINGKSFPDIDPLVVNTGEKVHIRLINAGTSTTHPMHLHGQSFKVISADGNPIPKVAQLTRDTISIAPGERYDIEINATNPGRWYFHCHELHHTEGGMAIQFNYDDYNMKKERVEPVKKPSKMMH